MWKNVPFKWDKKCQKLLQLAKEHLQSPPMMIYPDKSKPFHLFTDSSNFTWSSVLMQTESMSEIETSSVPSNRKEGSIYTSEYEKYNQKDRPPYAFFENEPLKAIVYHSGSFQEFTTQLVCICEGSSSYFQSSFENVILFDGE